MRDYVIGPAQAIWSVGPAALGFYVAYVKAGRAHASHSRLPAWWYLLSIVISCLFLPLWLVGLLIHGAKYAGGWF